MSMEYLPVIKLEVQGMAHAVNVALGQHQAQIDEYVQGALADITSASHLRRVVTEATKKAAQRAIEQALFDYFAYGQGRDAIKNSVGQAMAHAIPGIDPLNVLATRIKAAITYCNDHIDGDSSSDGTFGHIIAILEGVETC